MTASSKIVIASSADNQPSSYFHPRIVMASVGITVMVWIQFTSFHGNVAVGNSVLSFDSMQIPSTNFTSEDLQTLLNPSTVLQSVSVVRNTEERNNSSTNDSMDSILPSKQTATQEETTTRISTNVTATIESSTNVPDETKESLICHNESHHDKPKEYCCATWDVSSDDWWLHRPEYDISLENETHYCFSPIDNLDRASFLRQLHDFQWNNVNCTDIEKSTEINSGFGASTTFLKEGFWHAWKQSRKPFQIIHNYRRWLYSTNNHSSWAYCDTEDTRCYYLPINPCNRTFYYEGKEHHKLRLGKFAPELDKLHYHWMSHYLFRRNHKFRHQLYQFRVNHHLEPIAAPCLMMHVRRGDAGFPREPFRRYAPVQEYLNAVPNLKPNDTILLLTDDQSTIDEVQRYHINNYDWYYLDRPRVHNVEGGFDGHIPSGDEAYEMLVLDTELNIASRCDRFVNGKSGFVKGLLQSMDWEGKKYEHFYVDTEISKEEARKYANKQVRVKALMNDMEAAYQQNQTSPPPGDNKTIGAKATSMNEGTPQILGFGNKTRYRNMRILGG